MKLDTPNNRHLTEENISIPLDMLLEVLHIVVKESLQHQVTQVIENRSLIHLTAYINQQEPRQQKIIQNIKRLLSEYEEYRWNECETFNWKES